LTGCLIAMVLILQKALFTVQLHKQQLFKPGYSTASRCAILAGR